MPTEPKVTEIDASSSVVITRIMSDAELLILEQDRVLEEQRRNALQDIVATRESAKAKLAALGLTEAEVNALIGGA